MENVDKISADEAHARYPDGAPPNIADQQGAIATGSASNDGVGSVGNAAPSPTNPLGQDLSTPPTVTIHDESGAITAVVPVAPSGIVLDPKPAEDTGRAEPESILARHVAMANELATNRANPPPIEDDADLQRMTDGDLIARLNWHGLNAHDRSMALDVLAQHRDSLVPPVVTAPMIVNERGQQIG